MAASRWTFTKEQLANTPSRKMGIDADKELSYRQQAANLIQDMGQRLSVTQLCINTAIVYMHRFYMLRPFTKFPRNEMAPACLFLSCKVEEQPRKLEHVIKVAHSCLYRDNRPAPDPKTEAYLEQAQQLVINENILLQTLGFEVRVEHPHTFIVKATALVKASKDLSQSSYYLATNSLHMTTFCLQYRPTVVACVCMYLACKWAKYMIPKSNEGKEWFYYVDPSVTKELIEDLYNEFLNILDTCPTKLKKKIMGWKGTESQQRDMPNQDPTDLTGANPFPTTSQQRHERRDSSHHSGQLSRVPPTEHRSNQEHSLAHVRDVRPDQARDVQVDRRKDPHIIYDRKLHPAPGSAQTDHRGPRREETRGSHSNTQKKEALPQAADHRERHFQDSFKKDKAPVAVKREHDVNGRSSTPQPSRPQQEVMLTEQNVDSLLVKLETGTTATSGASDSQSSVTSVGAEMQKKTKSETAINFKEYMKRKEKEKKEKEQAERLRIQLEKEKEKRAKEAENLNKTYSEGMSNREQKPRPPKLDVSLPLPANLDEFSTKDVSERPYEVNIKSPIKPHKNITVKSPIKSSDLKQPKLELPKVQLTPEKDGSDPFSVNINSDPAIRKLIGKEASVVHSNGSDLIKLETMTRIKQEPGISPRLSPRVKPEFPHSGAIKMEPMFTLEVKVKHEVMDLEVNQEPKTIHTDPLTLKIKKESDKTSQSSIKVLTHFKDDLEPGEIDDSEPEINLLPEHVSAPAIKIRELGYDPDVGLESAHALKQAMEREALGGRATPGLGQSRVDGGTQLNTPIRMKIPRTHSQPESPSLKIKISTKGISTDSDHSSGKHSSPHRHKHKHKDKHKHKSHKHSRDKERLRDHDKLKDSQSSSSSVGTNGQSQSIKLSIKIGDLQSHSSPSATEVPGKQKLDKQKHRSSISDPALNRNASVEAERTQPWSMSDLAKPALAAAVAESPSRKRRRTSNVEPNTDMSQHKTAKMGPPRLRRSSSSHSVVSMEMSDEESCQTNGQIQTEHEPMINKLKDNLQQLIAQKQIEYIKNKQAHESRNSPMQALKKPIDRQQSGFDLDGMMWAGNSGDHPPLPSDIPAPPPPPPQQVARPPPR
ncbi:hypothetical protein DPMN_056878 [Dreissena polymorpha]|uniref:Cyclin-like domain-containing protein n=3 Tax=Dreissena polymorpha TaxID=45954 RepID=A0A9D4CSI6_DREPO|nr:hypothetical protein DPMN_056878 [Dreissena polymorpha]